MRVAMGSGAVLERSTPVLTFSPGVREHAETRHAQPSRAQQPPPALPVVRRVRSSLPIVRIERRQALQVRGLVAPIARAAGTSGGRTAGKLLAIAIALAALGLFAGLNMRSLTEGVEGPATTSQAAATGAGGRVSDATAFERLQARGTLAPRKEAALGR